MRVSNQRLLLFSTAMLFILLCGCSNKSSNRADAVAPTLNSITLLNAEGAEISQEETGWFLLPEVCTIKVGYSGTATKAEFYATPTGTETDAAKDLIGTIDVDGAASSVSLEWEPDSFMGYISVVLYNDDLSVSSEDSWPIKAISDE